MLDLLLAQPLLAGLLAGALSYAVFELRESVWHTAMRGPGHALLIGTSLWKRRPRPRRRRQMIAGFWALLAALMTSGAAALVLMSRPLGEAALGFVLVPYVWRLSQHLRALSMARWQNRNPRSAEGRVEYSDAFCRAYYPHVTASAALTLVLVLPFAFSPFLAGGILGLVARAGLEWLELAPRGKRK